MSQTIVNFTTLEKFKEKIAKLAADNNLEFDEKDESRLLLRLRSAYDVIVGILLSRGLNMLQISTFARGAEFQLDIATYWYGRDCKWGRKNFEDIDYIKVFDRTKELSEIPIVSNDGELISKSAGCVAVSIDLVEANIAKGYM